MDEILNDLLGNIDDDDIRDIIKLMIHTGRRPKEILKLSWEDIDFSNKKAFFINGKKKIVRQPVLLNEEVLQILKRRMR